MVHGLPLPLRPAWLPGWQASQTCLERSDLCLDCLAASGNAVEQRADEGAQAAVEGAPEVETMGF